MAVQPFPPPRDPRLLALGLAAVERVLAPYHRAEVRGLERVPDGPVLYVGNHNGATYSGDTWIFAAALWRARGVDALPYGLAHDLVLRAPVLGEGLRRLGSVPAHPDAAQRLLEAGHSVLVYPGGDLDALRPHRARDEVRFGGRFGFVRTALRAGVPIVPVAAQGAHDTLRILTEGAGLSRLLGVDRRFRLKVLPLAFSLPWGLTIGPTPPYIPLPARIRIEILPPVRFERAGQEAAADDAYAAACAESIRATLEAAVARLGASQ